LEQSDGSDAASQSHAPCSDEPDGPSVDQQFGFTHRISDVSLRLLTAIHNYELDARTLRIIRDCTQRTLLTDILVAAPSIDPQIPSSFGDKVV
jgi:hypothetical protein